MIHSQNLLFSSSESIDSIVATGPWSYSDMRALSLFTYPFINPFCEPDRVIVAVFEVVFPQVEGGGLLHLTAVVEHSAL